MKGSPRSVKYVRNVAAQSGDERQDADVEKCVQLEEEGKTLFANERGERLVLEVGNDAGLVPVVQPVERGHGPVTIVDRERVDIRRAVARRRPKYCVS